jgi:hypothetical protein
VVAVEVNPARPHDAALLLHAHVHSGVALHPARDAAVGLLPRGSRVRDRRNNRNSSARMRIISGPPTNSAM